MELIKKSCFCGLEARSLYQGAVCGDNNENDEDYESQDGDDGDKNNDDATLTLSGPYQTVTH